MPVPVAVQQKDTEEAGVGGDPPSVRLCTDVLRACTNLQQELNKPKDTSIKPRKVKAKAKTGEQDPEATVEDVRACRACWMVPCAHIHPQKTKASEQEPAKTIADSGKQQKGPTKAKLGEQDPNTAVEGVRYASCMLSSR